MMNFKALHPLVTFVYFAFVMAFAMAGYNPVIIAISALASSLYVLMLKKNLKIIFYIIPIMVFTAVLNPVFSHKGATILFYLGNPITLESILYGLCASFMLYTLIMWFSAFNAVFTSDKVMYLLGSIMPKSALVFSMTLRLVPRIKHQFKTILDCQKMLGNDVKDCKLIGKVKIYAKAVYSLIGWILEGALVTSDVMESKGYGSKKRTNFTLYSFTKRDKAVLMSVIMLGGFVLYGFLKGALRFEFYPVIYCENFYKGSIFYFAYMIISFLPVVYDYVEALKWKSLKSKI